MSDSLALLARTFIIGIAVAAPVGAMGVLCIQRTLADGWRAGLATGAGIATADALYASVAAFGVSSLSNAIATAQTPLHIVGGAALVLLGLRAVFAGPPSGAVNDEFDVSSAYMSALGLTLTNPMTIMAFAAVFASAGLVVDGGGLSQALATFGVALGSLTWWVGLTAVVSMTRHAVGPRAVRIVGIVSGLAVAGFGVYAVWGALG